MRRATVGLPGPSAAGPLATGLTAPQLEQDRLSAPSPTGTTRTNATPACGSIGSRGHPLRHARGLCRLCRQPQAPAASPETEPSLGQRAALAQGTHGRPGCSRAEGRLCRCVLREPLPDIAYYGPGFHDHESGRSERLSSESPAELRPVTGCSARVFNRVGPKRSGS